MSADLKYLAFTAILTASLWIPYIVCQVTTNGNLTPQNYTRSHAAGGSAVGQASGPDLPERG